MLKSQIKNHAGDVFFSRVKGSQIMPDTLLLCCGFGISNFCLNLIEIILND